jgi:predicted DNA-binding transcriptional regulator YafY
MRILAAVIREPGLTPSQLAERARVSERTLRRDLALLRRDGYPISYSDGYQVQELLHLNGEDAGSPGQGLGGVYEHQLRLLRAQVSSALAEQVERELEAEAPAALAGLIAHVLERRQA